MKKKYFIAILFALFAIFVSAQVMNDGSCYAQNSVLNTGRWVKIAVEKNGIYKLTYENLVSMGINNPANVRIFGYGGALLSEDFTKRYIDDLPEVAIYMKKSADGNFRAGDYILFYGQGVVSWTYGAPPNATDTDGSMFYRTRNYYANKGYYFVTSNVGVGKKIEMSQLVTANPNGDIDEFTHYALHEKELVNLANGGREFYGEELNSPPPPPFSTPNLLVRPEKVRVKIANRSTSQITVRTTINNRDLGNRTINGRGSSSSEIAIDNQFIFTFEPPATSNQTEIKLTHSPTSATANLDFVEINVRRRLTMDGNELYFRNKEFLNQNQYKRFVLTNADAATQIWDITDKQNIKQINTNLVGNQLTFVANTNNLREYLAIKPSANFPSPEIIGQISNQNLHRLPQADYIIIANKDFLGEAERLAQAHRQKNDLTVHVVDAEKIYNEFSSGTPDATAYRRFVKMFYDRAYSSQNANAKFPKYLLLFGTGSFDNRALLNNTTNPVRRLLTYQAINSVSGVSSYTSDDYFGYMDDNTGREAGGLVPNQNMKIGVGRFPVYSFEQAKTLVDKTINYMNNTLRGSWKNQILYIADDGDKGEHADSADAVSKITANNNPEILIKKLYFDAYPKVFSAAGGRYPDVERLLDDYIRQGVLMINYMGHGSPNNLASEQIMTKQSIDKMYNEKLPVFVTATCDFAPFDQFNESAGEKLLWNKNGGAVAIFSTTRTVLMQPNADLNKHFARYFSERDENCNPLALGDVFMKSKNSQTNSSNKFAFTLLGDPALKLAFPHPAKVITDSINFNPVNSLAFDTISALGIVHISGHIANCEGIYIQGFEGIVNIHVFDKEETITTLKNPGSGADENIHFKYQDRTNTIFVGSAEVKNGKFRIAFVVPKDIKYNFGTGRIVYYASEGNLGMEANGYFENFIVGGEAQNVAVDTIGPEVKLYMNTPTFRNGGQVNTSPVFFAEMFDESGINTVGSGIGHDITMRINGIYKDGKQMTKYNDEEIVLNNYYVSELGSYQRGKIEYQLNDLEEGNYTIKFRVWDMYNNSTNSEISFFVSTKGKIDADVDVYPNPVVLGEPITFSINHNRPGQLLDIGILVSDLAGRTVWRSSQQTITSGTETKIQWNPVAEGSALGIGLYIVRLELSTTNEKSTFVPLKLIIKSK